MAGNAAEWVFDYYDRDSDGFGYRGAVQIDPKGPPSGQLGHVVRGGSFMTGAYTLRTAARRFTVLPSTRDIGFRCAYDVLKHG
jgi:formylglycine-generating enzyme required for sulfatase activity